MAEKPRGTTDPLDKHPFWLSGNFWLTILFLIVVTVIALASKLTDPVANALASLGWAALGARSAQELGKIVLSSKTEAPKPEDLAQAAKTAADEQELM